MKCIKNTKTGNITRVNDIQANKMVGEQWSYVPKSEWKAQERPTKQINKEESKQ